MSRQSKYSYWFPPLLWMGIIFVMSSYTAAPVSEVDWMEFVFKKTIHMTEYGVLWWLCFRAVTGTALMSKSHAGLSAQAGWWSWVLVVLYAATDEWHQSWVPSRHGTVRDVMIDALGAGVAWMAVLYHGRKSKTR